MKKIALALLLGFYSTVCLSHETGCESPVEAQNIVEMFIHGRLEKIHQNLPSTDRIYWSNEFGLKFMLKCDHKIASHYLLFRDGKYSKFYYAAEVVNNVETHSWKLRSLKIQDVKGVELLNEENEI